MDKSKKYKKKYSKQQEIAKDKITASSYSLEGAVELLKKLTYVKFDEACDIAINLGVDTKKSDQLVRGTLLLPHGTGKKVKVAAIADGDDLEIAKKAGADIVGHLDLVNSIKSGKIDFDVCLATKNVMGEIRQLSRILGPKGLMPNLKSGTITDNIKLTIENTKKGQISFRTDKGGTVHTLIGKMSFPTKNLIENADATIKAILKAKPSTVKTNYLRSIYLSGTMTPSVAIEIKNFLT